MNLPTSEIIKEIRIQNRITQATFAKLIDVQQQSVARWEAGVALPHVNNIMAIYNIFGVTPNELLGVDKTSGIYKMHDFGTGSEVSTRKYLNKTQKKILYKRLLENNGKISAEFSTITEPLSASETIDLYVKSFLNHLERFTLTEFNCESCNHNIDEVCALTEKSISPKHSCTNWRVKLRRLERKEG